LTFLYTLAVAFLMVSRLPVYSGKRLGTRVSPEMVLPVLVLIVVFFALLLSYPWEVLSTGTVLFLASLPFGWFSYHAYQRKAAEAAGEGAHAAATGPASAEIRPEPSDVERPARLN